MLIAEFVEALENAVIKNNIACYSDPNSKANTSISLSITLMYIFNMSQILIHYPMYIIILFYVSSSH